MALKRRTYTQPSGQEQGDSDFHGHRLAVYNNQHLLWDLMSVDFGTLTWRSVHPALHESGPKSHGQKFMWTALVIFRQEFLLLVDSYSKWIKIHITNASTTAVTIEKLQ